MRVVKCMVEMFKEMFTGTLSQLHVLYWNRKLKLYHPVCLPLSRSWKQAPFVLFPLYGPTMYNVQSWSKFLKALHPKLLCNVVKHWFQQSSRWNNIEMLTVQDTHLNVSRFMTKGLLLQKWLCCRSICFVGQDDFNLCVQ